ncbi:hypothetical protein D3C78_1472340 [compost metagenome]
MRERAKGLQIDPVVILLGPDDLQRIVHLIRRARHDLTEIGRFDLARARSVDIPARTDGVELPAVTVDANGLQRPHRIAPALPLREHHVEQREAVVDVLGGRVLPYSKDVRLLQR